MKNPWIKIFICKIFLFGNVAWAATGSGNGGDFVRAVFLSEGSDALQSLRQTPALAKRAAALGVDPRRLATSLSIEVVQTVDGPLYDNRGSRVDALGEPGRIRLDADAWKGLILSGRDLRRLILHEMLRASGINDDDYKISGELVSTPPEASKSANPAFDYSRQAFADALAPRADQLGEGKAWRNCSRFKYDVNGDEFRDSGLSPSLVIRHWRANVYRLDERGGFLQLSDRSLSGFESGNAVGKTARFMSFRMLSNGDLVVELMGPKNEIPNGIAAVTNPSVNAESYLYCEPIAKN